MTKGGSLSTRALAVAAMLGALAIPRARADSAGTASAAAIGEVRIRIGEIFDLEDPKDRLPGARLVNRLHRSTRAEVVERQLLFRAGDRYDPRLLEESERLLRRDRYLRDVSVRPVARADGLVDVEVVAREVWTLNFGLSFGHAGGTSSTGVRVEDLNFLGTGRMVRLERRSDVDRTTNRMSLFDPRLFGRQLELDLDVEQASDGGGWHGSIERPFRSLDDRWSAAIAGTSEERVESLYLLGHEVEQFRHELALYELSGGWSPGLRHGGVARWSAGVRFERHRFASLVAGDPAPPPDRLWSSVWLGWAWQHDRFETTRNLDQIGRTEDLHLGLQLTSRIGMALPALGSEGSALLFDGEASWARQLGEGGLLRARGAVGGRLVDGRIENGKAAARLRLAWRNFGDQELSLAIEGDLARAPDRESQLTLGGDSGLRGYPLRYQTGSARALVSLEQRLFTDWYPLRLARVGGAIFVDAGRTWGGPAAASRGLLWDLGIGLRLAPTRSGRAGVVHFDLAMPLGGDPEVRRLQWLVRTRTSF